MKAKYFYQIVFIFLAVAIVLMGCSRGGEKAENDHTPKSVTLQLASEGASTLMNDEFEEIVQKYIYNKYPHITVHFNPDVIGTRLNDLITAGQPPDLVVSFNGNLSSYYERELVFDMSALFKEQNVDLERFEANYITDIKNASELGQLFGLPININYHAMYYNKDIFDKFGVDYLDDGLTWEDLLPVAKKLTQIDSGTQYRGLDPGNGIIWMSQPLSIAAIDPQTNQASVNNEAWKRVFALAKSIFEIPGNEQAKIKPKDQFMKDKTLGILLDLNILTQLTEAEQSGLNWDVAQYPSYQERPNTYGNASVYVMMGTKSTKYPIEAAQIIDLLTSEEVQLDLSRHGKLSPLRSTEIKSALGEMIPSLQNKGLSSIFKSKPVSYPIASEYRTQGENILTKHFNQFLNGGVDANTALSRAEEEINAMLRTASGE